ncbi:uncharacterized protein F5891DRAFT_743724 [Suillus fuscotomentosus]|uniref:Fungal-type protein kinase domain-containing protein n=1 Tax=Suillus fuscotomentosus TaxID=1912939 RepID=A0AAD4DU83_9AGAM|nr:uncharacterized protein F5891DRAFT_743724 [Suillus fuscotomentosus]KAG1893857.1 hypothetical protein F5891DRAFT_743724 [Suillus fuscotomentosus]
MSPAGETGTSSTPPRANASNQGGSKIEFTPYSRGASVISENISLVGVQVKEVRPWIQRDIEQAKQCKADAMLQALLQRASCAPCAPKTKQPELLQKCLKGVLPVCNGQVSNGTVAKIFWGEAGRTSEPKILDKVEEITKVHPTVEGHIPELFWCHAFTNSACAIREALGVPESSMSSRMLYILVFRRLYPITKLNGKDLFDVWRQCILCHLTLWKEGVHHRDISPGSLLWYRKNGRLIGVLNDYDLSSLANAVGPQGNERTGTVPFMALDLLTKEGQQGKAKYLYRHDLESFMWVFAWICFRYRQGVLLLRRSRPLDEWATSHAIACGVKKLAFLTNLSHYLPADFRTSQSTIDLSLLALLVDCFRVLQAANSNRADDMYHNLVVELGWMEGTYEQIDAEETVSDMDDFLGKFTGTKAWVKLSNTLPL